MTCNSTDSGRPVVDPGCIIYDNCTVPTIWCSHNDPSYSGTQHGVPCFAISLPNPVLRRPGNFLPVCS